MNQPLFDSIVSPNLPANGRAFAFRRCRPRRVIRFFSTLPDVQGLRTMRFCSPAWKRRSPPSCTARPSSSRPGSLRTMSDRVSDKRRAQCSMRWRRRDAASAGPTAIAPSSERPMSKATPAKREECGCRSAAAPPMMDHGVRDALAAAIVAMNSSALEREALALVQTAKTTWCNRHVG